MSSGPRRFYKQTSIVAAVDDDLGIGKDGDIPWKCTEDLRWFKSITMGQILIMGRKTYDSVGSLPGRNTIVVSRTPRLDNGAIFVDSLPKAKIRSYEYPGRVFIVGGAEIYEKALELDMVDTMYITHIPGKHDCDTYFPLISPDWECLARTEHTYSTILFFSKDESC